MDIGPDCITTLKATLWIYLVSTPLGMLSNIPGVIFVMAQVIFSPLSWGDGMAVRRNTIPPLCTGGKGGKAIIIHFFCMRQE